MATYYLYNGQGYLIGSQGNPATLATIESPPDDIPDGQAAKWVGEWILVPDLGYLQYLRDQKNLEINSARLIANRSSFTYSGKDVACDELSRSDIDGINGYIALNNDLPAGWPGGWKAIDNTYIMIPDIDTWKQFYGAMIMTGNANFAKAQALKTTLAAAMTAEDINAISW